MTVDYHRELKETFGASALVRVAARTLNANEWKEFRTRREVYEKSVEAEKRFYEQEYQTRVEVVRKRLIHEAGAKSRDFKHRWFGRDKFDREAIDRQAHRIVRKQHQNELDHLQNWFVGDAQEILERSEHRKRRDVRPKRDFYRATDRRFGQDRRQRFGPSR